MMIWWWYSHGRERAE